MLNEYPPTPGSLLANERDQIGVGIEELAAAMGVSRWTVYRIERAPMVKHKRAAKYRRALRLLADQAIAS